MINAFSASRTQIARQVQHWTMAAERLRELESLASPNAWAGLERYLGLELRRTLKEAVGRLLIDGRHLDASFRSATTIDELVQVRHQLVVYRRQYLRTETTIDFYTDAVNTRSNPEIAALLRACDSLAQQSMAKILAPLGRDTPLVLTFRQKGLGASVLKSNTLLWDQRTESPAAAIKLVLHNQNRPTALIHESGHEVAHIVGWNEELAAKLFDGIHDSSNELAQVWSTWASEIAADAVAFVITGHASIAGLHDVLAGQDAFVFAMRPLDPHPVAFLRILLTIEWARAAFADDIHAPWEDMRAAWFQAYPPQNAPPAVQDLIGRSLPLLPRIASIVLNTPMKSFNGRALTDLVDPGRVSPSALRHMEDRVGTSLYTSSHWIWTESLRLLALTGLQFATQP